MRTEAFLNEVYADCIMLFDGAGNPKTGESGNVAKKLQKNGAYSATPTVTVTEVDSTNYPGLYRMTVTPDAVGDWDIRLSHSTYAKEGWLSSFNVKKRISTFIFDASFNTAGSSLAVLAGLMLDGTLHTNPASVTVVIYNSSATVITTLTSSSADANGLFSLTYSSPSLTSGNIYYAKITIVDANTVSYVMETVITVE